MCGQIELPTPTKIASDLYVPLKAFVPFGSPPANGIVLLMVQSSQSKNVMVPSRSQVFIRCLMPMLTNWW